ncbi:exonuclease [Kineococcus xinjiangensis]|uniref:Exonuclease n=1 Tax=Kineococcus xinjiangensis TaxID=512762 RepID=A0A2S6ICF8_9ACTN|nr:3'-5' exonuclease [Kineococcus xinjiangensis]PPK91905.1 exonuclease [Kineococcus xinjiangensis]
MSTTVLPPAALGTSWPAVPAVAVNFRPRHPYAGHVGLQVQGRRELWGEKRHEDSAFHLGLLREAITARDHVEAREQRALAVQRHALEVLEAHVAPWREELQPVLDPLPLGVLITFAWLREHVEARELLDAAGDVRREALERAACWLAAEAQEAQAAAVATQRWAQEMTRPGQAVVLDVESSDRHGDVVELGVIDAADGETLLHTLIRPATPITADTEAVHGISNADVADAPTLAEVLPDLLAVTDNRSVLAYNCWFDHATLLRSAAHTALDLHGLEDEDRWDCIMRRWTGWSMQRRWQRLDGGHRVLDDCRRARSRLLTMTNTPQQRWAHDITALAITA